jgi:hypothetical protein
VKLPSKCMHGCLNSSACCVRKPCSIERCSSPQYGVDLRGFRVLRHWVRRTQHRPRHPRRSHRRPCRVRPRPSQLLLLMLFWSPLRTPPLTCLDRGISRAAAALRAHTTHLLGRVQRIEGRASLKFVSRQSNHQCEVQAKQVPAASSYTQPTMNGCEGEAGALVVWAWAGALGALRSACVGEEKLRGTDRDHFCQLGKFEFFECVSRIYLRLHLHIDACLAHL